MEYFIIIDLNQVVTGEAIKLKRQSLNWTADTLAKHLKVKVANLYKWEKGHLPSNPMDYNKLEKWLLGAYDDQEIPIENRIHSNIDSKTSKSNSYKIILEPESFLELIKSSMKEYADKLIDEKEARRIDAERNKEEWKKAFADLMHQFNSGLNKVAKSQDEIQEAMRVSAAYQMFWMDKWAEKEAAGNPEEAERLAASYRKEVIEKRTGKKSMGNPSGPGK